LEKLVRAQLAPFIGTEQARLEIDGPAVSVAAEVVQTLGLALHELATNASKHGALSVPEGKILLRWEFNGGGSIPECFRPEWRELGGPTVKPTERRGFGRFVTDHMVTRSLHATVEIDLAPERLRGPSKCQPAKFSGRCRENRDEKTVKKGSKPLFDVGLKRPKRSDCQ
jgi:two-component system CheB/CheR fusion protein